MGFISVLEVINNIFSFLTSVVLSTAKFWLPFVLIVVGWKIWLRFRRMKWISGLSWHVLEIRIPKNVYKSPLAMETVLLQAMHQSGGISTKYKRNWQGKALIWFSLEIVSNEGDVKFYIRTPFQFKNIVESQIYAHYPNAEVVEVEDYVYPILADMHKQPWQLWGAEFRLKKEEVYPIRTYVDFGLDKAVGSTEEEERVDPITGQIEWMSTLGKNQHAWVQYVIRAHKDSLSAPGSFWGKKEGVRDKAQRVIDKLRSKYIPEVDEENALSALTKGLKMTKGEQETIAAIERSVSKPMFDVGIRTMYLAPETDYQGVNVLGLVNFFKQYDSTSLNSLGIRYVTDFDDPWQDITGKRELRKQRKTLDAYINRSFFYPPYIRKFTILSSEELATLYHFPGRVTETPTFDRVESSKAQPPINLPV